MLRERKRVVVTLLLSFCMPVLACGAFGGSDGSGGGGGDDAGAGDREEIADSSPIVAPDASDGGAGQKDSSAADAGCISFVVPAVADTYLLDDGAHCNASITFGNATVLHVAAGPAAYALARFNITSAQLMLLDSKAKIVVAAAGASCGAGPCEGFAWAMRSDWVEGPNGDSQAADLCRRDALAGGWAAGLNNKIAQPADYDSIPAASMSFSGGTWGSAPLLRSAVTGRLVGDAGTSGVLSLLFTINAGALTFPSREGALGMAMTVTRCE